MNAIDTQICFVNIFTALTFGTIVFFILHVSSIGSDSDKLLPGAIVAVIFLFNNPITLPAEEETIEDTVEQELSK